MGKISKKISREIFKRTFFPFFALLLFSGAYFFYKAKISFLISAQLRQQAENLLKTIFIIAAGLIAQKVAEAALGWYKENISSKTDIRLDDELIPLLRRALKVLIWALVLLIILPVYGVNISALVAALGVGSLAVALAAQDTIANIISGFMIMIDRPFRIGDKIKLPSGETVEVLEIGVRRSKFYAEDKAIVIAPNLELSKSKIINYSYTREGVEKNEV